jgi:iron complex transport system ATP-binding protein
MEAIKVNNLTVAYDQTVVIDHMNVSIPKGKITILIGANGCGKSTLLKTIARILKPVKGSVFINGSNIRHQKPKKIAAQMAVLPQSPKCPDGLTVKELIAYGRFPHQKMTGGLTVHDKELIEWAIDETGLRDFADRPVESLSGGQRQRAWIALTLAQETDIILLDEPTTYLDMSYQLEILQLLKKLNVERKITVVIVLHELNNACRFADHVIGLKKGKIICEGPPNEVITSEVLKRIYGIEARIETSKTGGYPICFDYELARSSS